MGNNHFNAIQTSVMAARGTGTEASLIPAIQAASTALGKVIPGDMLQAISTNPTLSIAQSILPSSGFAAQEAVSGNFTSQVVANKANIGRGGIS